MLKPRQALAVGLLALVACATEPQVAATEPAATGPDSPVARGEYLTTMLGCGGCHTDGALLGRPSGTWLAGSQTGIAYTADEHGEHPGVVFPRNLTPDPETGLGSWSEQDIVHAIAGGRGHSGERLSAVMPWMNYSLVKANDLRAIAAYLKSLPPIQQAIPANIAPGDPVTAPYIRIGIYQFNPSGSLESVIDPTE